MSQQTFLVTKEIEFDAGHRVPLHNSQCRNPHGHRYKVQATWSGPLQEEGSSTGMVVDFSDLKNMLMKIHDEYDHSFIYCQDDAWAITAFEGLYRNSPNNFKTMKLDIVPTAENLARAFFFELNEMTVQTYGYDGFRDIHLEEVRVWETPTSVATFTRGLFK